MLSCKNIKIGNGKFFLVCICRNIGEFEVSKLNCQVIYILGIDYYMVMNDFFGKICFDC